MVRICLFCIILLFGSTVFGQTDSLFCAAKIDSLTQMRIVQSPDKMPEPFGGIEALIDSITSNLVLKDQATIVGKIYLAFIVDEDGSVSGERTLRNPGYSDLDRQAIIIIKKHRWIPAECKGKKVAALYILPIYVGYR